MTHGSHNLFDPREHFHDVGTVEGFHQDSGCSERGKSVYGAGTDVAAHEVTADFRIEFLEPEQGSWSVENGKPNIQKYYVNGPGVCLISGKSLSSVCHRPHK